MDEQRPDSGEGYGEDGATAEGCGCIAMPRRSATEAPPDALAANNSADTACVASAPPGETPLRPLKLVATLHLSIDGGYHAILALGSDDCDPLIRVLDAPDLATALAAAPALLAEAHDRWQTQPRYPSVRPVSRGNPTKAEAPAVPPAPADGAQGSPTPSSQPAPAATPAKPSSGQLSLFG